jgi:hypothetical protein
MTGLRRLGACVATLAIMAACGTSTPASPAHPTASAGIATPGSSPVATSAPTPAKTLPAGVTRLHDGRLAPGTYRFDGFEPGVELEVAGDGWEVGHFHDDFFDLFLDGDFPAIGFGRFSDVLLPDGSRVPATSAAAVIQALRSNADVVVEDLGAVEIASLTGQTIEIRVSAEQTPLFSSDEGAFRFDPGFAARLHLLDLPDGGALEVLVAARRGGLKAAIEATDPILRSLVVLD